MRLPVLILIALIVAPLVGFLPKLFRAPTPEPLDRRPAAAQLLVVTVDRLPLELTGPGFDLLRRRAARAEILPAASASQTASRLWTGRAGSPGPPVSPGSTGSIGSGAATSPWTVAEAAGRSGAATAAFLTSPLVSDLGLGGFETVVEDPALGAAELARLAADHLAAHPSERTAAWIHLADGDIDRLLLDLLEAYDRSGHRWDTLAVVTALGPNSTEATIPFWAALPSALYADRAGEGAAPCVDLAHLLLTVLRLPGPDVTRGEVPIETGTGLATLLQGGRVD